VQKSAYLKREKMKEKTKQLLTYISKNYMPATVTSLMKLAYLIDLVAISKDDNKISDFEYRRYKYGPFDSRIYEYLSVLVKDNIFKEEIEYTNSGDEYITYKFNDEKRDIRFEKLSEKDFEAINEVIESVRGYGVKILTQITYKTKPMLALGATLGGEENLNAPIDLKAK